MESPKTLQQAIQYFSNFENCQQFMIANRWADGKVRCPQCDSLEVKYLPSFWKEPECIALRIRCIMNHADF
jgi:transposase-like protein